MLRILLLLFCLNIGCFAQGYNYLKANTHPLYEERKNKLFGVYGTFNKAESDAKLNINAITQTHKLTEKQFGLGLQFGYLLSQNHRILANLEHHLKKNGFSYQLLTLGYAFTPKIPNTEHWRLLLGINVGLAQGNFDSGSFVINDSALETLKFTGFTFGVKAGAIYTASYGELEFGIQARRLNFGAKNSTLATGESVRLDLGQTSTLGGYIGYNFLF